MVEKTSKLSGIPSDEVGAEQTPVVRDLFAQLISPMTSGVTHLPSKPVQPNVVDGVRVVNGVRAMKPSTVPVFRYIKKQASPDLKQAYDIILARDFRKNRISDDEIVKLLPPKLRNDFLNNRLTDDLYSAVKDIMVQCPKSNQTVTLQEIEGVKINGAVVQVYVELRAARRQVSEALRKRQVNKKNAISVLSQNGYGDEKYMCLVKPYQPNGFIPRQVVAELLVEIDRRFAPLVKPSRRRAVDSRVTVEEPRKTNPKKLPVLSVAFRNAVHCEQQRTGVDMHIVSGAFPPEVRAQFNKFENAGGMKSGGELEMTQDVLKWTRVIYSSLPDWQSLASEDEVNGVHVGRGYIQPMMSFNTAKRQLAEFNKSAAVDKKLSTKEALLGKGFDEKEIDQVLEIDTGNKYSVSRAMVANALVLIKDRIVQ